MTIEKKRTTWFGFGAKRETREEGPQKTRCIHCNKEFRTAYGFHLSCKECRSDDDYRRSFEWALALAELGAKA